MIKKGDNLSALQGFTGGGDHDQGLRVQRHASPLAKTEGFQPSLCIGLLMGILIFIHRYAYARSNEMSSSERYRFVLPCFYFILKINLFNPLRVLLTITVVEDASDLQKWIVPVKVAFEMNDTVALQYQYSLELAHHQFIHFIAKKYDLVIGAASLFLHNEIAGLYNLAVLREFRKQGIATALHYARLNEAKNRGYTHATLQATPMASRFDSSLGFVTHSELSIIKC